MAVEAFYREPTGPMAAPGSLGLHCPKGPQGPIGGGTSDPYGTINTFELEKPFVEMSNSMLQLLNTQHTTHQQSQQVKLSNVTQQAQAALK